MYLYNPHITLGLASDSWSALFNLLAVPEVHGVSPEEPRGLPNTQKAPRSPVPACHGPQALCSSRGRCQGGRGRRTFSILTSTALQTPAQLRSAAPGTACPRRVSCAGWQLQPCSAGSAVNPSLPAAEEEPRPPLGRVSWLALPLASPCAVATVRAAARAAELPVSRQSPSMGLSGVLREGQMLLRGVVADGGGEDGDTLRLSHAATRMTEVGGSPSSAPWAAPQGVEGLGRRSSCLRGVACR